MRPSKYATPGLQYNFSTSKEATSGFEMSRFKISTKHSCVDLFVYGAEGVTRIVIVRKEIDLLYTC